MKKTIHHQFHLKELPQGFDWLKDIEEWVARLRLLSVETTPSIILTKEDNVLTLTRDYLIGEPHKLTQSSLESCEDFLTQLLQALSGFHKFNIPHGNLTPENIIHMEEGIRLTDPMPPCYNALLGITDIDLFRRLRYGPPETAMGFPVDCRGDLYRVGIFLYIKITGDHPFAAYDPILEGQRHVSMIPPSLLDYQPEISPCLAGLIHRFLAKDPDERPESSLVALEILRNQIILPTLEEAPFQERQDEATAKPSPFMAQVVSVILILVTFAVLVLLLESFRWDFLH